MVYLDNAATTPITQPVLEAMMPYLTTQYGNPSALYNFGREARKAVEKARKKIAKAINAETNQIVFTSSATESNNWACSNFNRVMCSPYEHHSVLNHPNTIQSTQFCSLEWNIQDILPDLVFPHGCK